MLRFLHVRSRSIFYNEVSKIGILAKSLFKNFHMCVAGGEATLSYFNEKIGMKMTKKQFLE